MNARPAHEPTREFSPSHKLLNDATRNSKCLGCPSCPDFKVCGGLNIDADVYDCNDLCSCANPDLCDMVCRNKPVTFFERFMEVGGFELDTVPRVSSVAAAALPVFVPLIDHKHSRKATLLEPVVAVSLFDLFHRGTGEPLVRNREELADRFLIRRDAVLVVSGVDRDVKIEAWWALANRQNILKTLRHLGVALVTTPNFSLFTNVPRPDNLHGMKRIALSWAQLMSAGIPAALHVNARTEHDYARWARFVADRAEVESIAFEFGTGAGYPGRINWHVEQLCQLADNVERNLTLVVRGGVHVLHQLRKHFARVILIDTDSFARTLKRRRATVTATGRLRWVQTQTPRDAPIDDLLMHNIATRREVLSQITSAAPVVLERAFRAPRRPTQDADRQPWQRSFVKQFEASLQAGAVPIDLKGVIAASES
ncbi:MAG: hypothetical protein JWQ90_3563 [Hydrocarboniphaga sp.]|uniref:DUF4417 domain-containing protein n=1 Tax=Hydrocarboniphaga sp. TaxID=2033016 RepID=UPI00261D26A1|nr:DUF4417 domain-containing protein [Hydrocarboniphaga sp.]MDB5971113.1 hypothetical protein [Hydrocarboniphaga sp.]